MPRGPSKRGYHKQDMQKVNRTALVVGGVTAAVLLLVMVVSFIR
ncbi:MAG: hypothetical protein RIN56_13445 [Sporomusaceae bacterium]|nr:hypothetical protein [Sporomusaceae bacterium]